jgi:prepilin-type N-terminal cleavage/methylation domain-containing protein/prepilin-type processing-associated H-X9-DG protein
MGRNQNTTTKRLQARGFTIIELLVVVAIIALLISILLPAMSEARKDARAVACAAQLHHVGQAVTIYTTRNMDRLPASYLYASDSRGNWKLSDQQLNAAHPNGYLHWSYFLYNDGRVDEKSFQCPELDNGGHAKTNPGSGGWTAGQVDENGSTASGQVTDKQATWVAYTGNAALMSRNKFVPGSPFDRHNVFVNQSSVRAASKTILATEFGKSFSNVSISQGSGRLSKAHRPVHPFYDRFSGGYNIYSPGAGKSRQGVPPPFTYGNCDTSVQAGGIKEVGQYETQDDIIDDANDVNKANCVGRHHPGGGLKQFGGTANFLYLDAHVERKSVLDTIMAKEWGDRFYSLAGDNRVDLTASPNITK